MKVLVVVACILLSACGKSSPTAPSTLQIAGVWTGVIKTITPGGQPDGQVQFAIAQTGTALTGNWGTSYADPSNNNSGTMSGFASATGLTFTLQPSVPTYCPYNVTASMVGASMSGTFAAVNCSAPIAGSFTAVRP